MDLAMRALADRLRSAVRDVPDFPKPGILFKDITPILADPTLFHTAVGLFVARHQKSEIHKVACVDARGFLFGAAVAYGLKAGVVPIRKKGKLPWRTVEREYELEYGTAGLAMHEDAITPGERVLLMDDLIATGGTARAAAELIQQAGGRVVEADFLIELTALKGRAALAPFPVFAPIAF
jgi:adenine phosphoribosyltransferase